ncbi:MAG: HAD family hydrolase [Actinomycetota bacterium]|nr:HAD family hydrolase [Actinomycetota bacterium]
MRPSCIDSVRAVLFDFYGTLARAVSWGDTHEQVFARHGLAFDPERWGWNFVGEANDGDEHLEHSVNREAYVAWEVERLRRRARNCGVGEDDLDALVDDLHKASKTYTLEAYDEVPDVLAALRQRGVAVAICSNWDWDLERAVAVAALAGMADVVVTSAQAGARKPHPRIFRHTLERCGVGPDEALFVGDTLSADVEGPLAYGMPAVHVWRNEMEGEPPPLPEGATRVTDLRPVLDLLEST